MKQTYLVYAIFVFAIIMSITMPRIATIVYQSNHEGSSTYETQNKKQLAKAITPAKSTAKVATEASKVELAIATPTIKEEPKEEEVKEEVQTTEIKEETPKVEEKSEEEIQEENIANQLNKLLKSTLANTGNLFAKYSNQYGVDPFLATAIALHETGCSWSCSSAVNNKHNVGGMMGSNGLIYFDSLEAGIEAFIKNLKKNYYDYGLTTPEQMNKKYASSTTWASKINDYINKLKNA